MRATKKHLAGIVAATTVSAFVLYRVRSWGDGSSDDPAETDTDAEAAA